MITKEYTFCRLDGKTLPKDRQPLVDSFNQNHDPCTIIIDINDIVLFLLSAKAGGVGLNLIGASRLVLFDIDW